MACSLLGGPPEKDRASEARVASPFRSFDQSAAEKSDFVSVHSPLPKTRDRANRSASASFAGSDRLPINTCGRGPIVDEIRSCKALASGRSAGAGAHVFSEHEPQGARARWSRFNVVRTPHLGHAGRRWREQMSNIVVDNILAILDGKRPPNCVNSGSVSGLSVRRARDGRDFPLRLLGTGMPARPA